MCEHAIGLLVKQQVGNDIAKARQTFFLRKVGQVKYPSSLGACIAISGLIECQQ